MPRFKPRTAIVCVLLTAFLLLSGSLLVAEQRGKLEKNFSLGDGIRGWWNAQLHAYYAGRRPAQKRKLSQTRVKGAPFARSGSPHAVASPGTAALPSPTVAEQGAAVAKESPFARSRGTVAARVPSAEVTYASQATANLSPAFDDAPPPPDLIDESAPPTPEPGGHLAHTFQRGPYQPLPAVASQVEEWHTPMLPPLPTTREAAASSGAQVRRSIEIAASKELDPEAITAALAAREWTIEAIVAPPVPAAEEVEEVEPVPAWEAASVPEVELDPAVDLDLLDVAAGELKPLQPALVAPPEIPFFPIASPAPVDQTVPETAMKSEPAPIVTAVEPQPFPAAAAMETSGYARVQSPPRSGPRSSQPVQPISLPGPLAQGTAQFAAKRPSGMPVSSHSRTPARFVRADGSAAAGLPKPAVKAPPAAAVQVGAVPGYPHFSGSLYPCPQPYVPYQVGGTIITNQALAPHEMLYPHDYRAVYPPYYYKVRGGWILTPWGVQSYDRWKLMGTEVEVKYRSHISLFSGFSKPVIR